AIIKGICPKTAVAEMERVLMTGQYPASEYFRAATMCARVADTCEPEERARFGNLARDYSSRAILAGYDRGTVVNDRILGKWVEDLPTAEVTASTQRQDRTIPIGLADPLRSW